jgi:hypothetical protein
MNYAEVSAKGLTHDSLGNPLVAWCPYDYCKMEHPHFHSMIICTICGKETRTCAHGFHHKLGLAGSFNI